MNIQDLCKKIQLNASLEQLAEVAKFFELQKLIHTANELNKMLEVDPRAISALFSPVYNCSPELANTAAYIFPSHAGAGEAVNYNLNVLGIVQGITEGHSHILVAEYHPVMALNTVCHIKNFSVIDKPDALKNFLAQAMQSVEPSHEENKD